MNDNEERATSPKTTPTANTGTTARALSDSRYKPTDFSKTLITNTTTNTNRQPPQHSMNAPTPEDLLSSPIGALEGDEDTHPNDNNYELNDHPVPPLDWTPRLNNEALLALTTTSLESTTRIHVEQSSPIQQQQPHLSSHRSWSISPSRRRTNNSRASKGSDTVRVESSTKPKNLGRMGTNLKDETVEPSRSSSSHHAEPPTPSSSATTTCTTTNDRGWGDWDIPLGRSQEVREFVGNRRYRALVDDHRAAYTMAQRRADKTAISNTIYATIRARGGRFLDKRLVRSNAPTTTTTTTTTSSPKSNTTKREEWYEISQEKALAKISQALRIPSMSTSSSSSISTTSCTGTERTEAHSPTQIPSAMVQERSRTDDQDLVASNSPTAGAARPFAYAPLTAAAAASNPGAASVTTAYPSAAPDWMDSATTRSMLLQGPSSSSSFLTASLRQTMFSEQQQQSTGMDRSSWNHMSQSLTWNPILCHTSSSMEPSLFQHPSSSPVHSSPSRGAAGSRTNCFINPIMEQMDLTSSDDAGPWSRRSPPLHGSSPVSHSLDEVVEHAAWEMAHPPNDEQEGVATAVRFDSSPSSSKRQLEEDDLLFDDEPLVDHNNNTVIGGDTVLFHDPLVLDAVKRGLFPDDDDHRSEWGPQTLEQQHHYQRRPPLERCHSEQPRRRRRLSPPTTDPQKEEDDDDSAATTGHDRRRDMFRRQRPSLVVGRRRMGGLHATQSFADGEDFLQHDPLSWSTRSITSTTRTTVETTTTRTTRKTTTTTSDGMEEEDEHQDRKQAEEQESERVESTTILSEEDRIDQLVMELDIEPAPVVLRAPFGGPRTSRPS